MDTQRNSVTCKHCPTPIHEGKAFRLTLDARGFSYGTLLGAVFAALYPDQVERMILDGVCSTLLYCLNDQILTSKSGVADPTEWFKYGLSGGDLRDADSALEDFFDLCFRAGPSHCPFWFESPTAIRNAFFELDNRIHARPIPVGSKFVLNWARWRQLTFRALYTPLEAFPLLANTFALAYNNSLPSLTNISSILPNINRPPSPIRIETVLLISCSDRPFRQYKNEQELQAFLNTRKGKIFAQFVLGGFEIGCARAFI